MPKGRRRKEKNILTIDDANSQYVMCHVAQGYLLLCTLSESTLESAADEDYDGKHAVLRPQVIHRAAS